MKLQQHFEYFYERTYGVMPVFLVESNVYALHNQQIAYECFLNGYSLGYDEGSRDGWDNARDTYS